MVVVCSKVFRQYSEDARVAKDWDKLLITVRRAGRAPRPPAPPPAAPAC